MRPKSSILRNLCRINSFCSPTSGEAPGFVQANLVLLPEEYSSEFRSFCQANPAPCPLLEETDPLCENPWECRRLAPGSDIRTDIPKYVVWENGRAVEERSDVKDICEDSMKEDNCGWRGFLLGCSFSWEEILVKNNLTPRHIEEKCNVPMYNTSIPLTSSPSGLFKGNMVVSMRPYAENIVEEVSNITSQYPAAHGAPVHIKDYKEIGINALETPDYGDPVTIKKGEVPMFWACGVTPQNALQRARIPLAITHAPGYMFVCDVSVEDIGEWKYFPP
eukprot:g1935.t1